MGPPKKLRPVDPDGALQTEFYPDAPKDSTGAFLRRGGSGSTAHLPSFDGPHGGGDDNTVSHATRHHYDDDDYDLIAPALADADAAAAARRGSGDIADASLAGLEPKAADDGGDSSHQVIRIGPPTSASAIPLRTSSAPLVVVSAPPSPLRVPHHDFGTPATAAAAALPQRNSSSPSYPPSPATSHRPLLPLTPTSTPPEAVAAAAAAATGAKRPLFGPSARRPGSRPSSAGSLEDNNWFYDDDGAVDWDASPPGGAATASVTLNGTRVNLPAGVLLGLSLLGAPPCCFLYVDGEFVRLSRRGVPSRPITVRDGMNIVVQEYPAFWPADTIYWAVMNYTPSRKEVSEAAESAWGHVAYNTFNLMATALVSRPLINRSGSTIQAIAAVVSTARILDIVVTDTIYKLVSESRLHLLHVLVILCVAELAAMVAGSASISCLRLLEYRIVPMLLLVHLLLVPLLHRGWTLLGYWLQPQRSRVDAPALPGRPSSPAAAALAVAAIVLPVAVVIGLFAIDANQRVQMGWVDPFAC